MEHNSDICWALRISIIVWNNPRGGGGGGAASPNYAYYTDWQVYNLHSEKVKVLRSLASIK